MTNVLWRGLAAGGYIEQLSLRLPLTRKFLRLGDLRRGHVPRDFVSHLLWVTARRRQVEPHHVGENKVLRHALTVGVHSAVGCIGRGRRLGQRRGEATSMLQRWRT